MGFRNIYIVPLAFIKMIPMKRNSPIYGTAIDLILALIRRRAFVIILWSLSVEPGLTYVNVPLSRYCPFALMCTVVFKIKKNDLPKSGKVQLLFCSSNRLLFLQIK